MSIQDICRRFVILTVIAALLGGLILLALSGPWWATAFVALFYVAAYGASWE